MNWACRYVQQWSKVCECVSAWGLIISNENAGSTQIMYVRNNACMWLSILYKTSKANELHAYTCTQTTNTHTHTHASIHSRMYIHNWPCMHTLPAVLMTWRCMFYYDMVDVVCGEYVHVPSTQTHESTPVLSHAHTHQSTQMLQLKPCISRKLKMNQPLHNTAVHL